jgi:hypothetical protein
MRKVPISTSRIGVGLAALIPWDHLPAGHIFDQSLAAPILSKKALAVV